jgi:UDP:flavonoid glycosyltransferase YjiC (YdhE family)
MTESSRRINPLSAIASAIAYFVSPHGFGHAARSAAVMQTIQSIEPDVRIEILTLVPKWFFEESLAAEFGYHPVLTDIGLAQESSLRENIPLTLERLDAFMPFRPESVERLAHEVAQLGCDCVVCDIAPLGIAVAHAAGIPSILVENFTWDWIYAGYSREDERINRFISYLKGVFAQADYHIQTEPVCAYTEANLRSRPVSRLVRTPADVIRERLGIDTAAQTVLITMGGIPGQHAFVDQLAQFRSIHFVIPGSAETEERHENVILLPHRSDFYHPDLVNASDAIVGKSGYSTVAETYWAGIPFGYVSRSLFRESEIMAGFIQKEMSGMAISEPQFLDGSWLAGLPQLLSLPRIKRTERNGAEEIARFILRSTENR